MTDNVDISKILSVPAAQVSHQRLAAADREKLNVIRQFFVFFLMKDGVRITKLFF